MYRGTLIDDLFAVVESAENSLKPSHARNTDAHAEMRKPSSNEKDQPEGTQSPNSSRSRLV
jgi:hypothetical protein